MPPVQTAVMPANLLNWIFLSSACDACAGYFDNLTFGVTEYGRDRLDLADRVDTNSWAYTLGERVGDLGSGGIAFPDVVLELTFASPDAHAARRGGKGGGQKSFGAMVLHTLDGARVRAPAPRHKAAKVTQGTVAKPKNTVIDPDVDIGADIMGINDGKATLGRSEHGELTATINGRTYVVEASGTLSPRTGEGFTTLDRGAFKALGVFNKFGPGGRADEILGNMDITSEQQAAALQVWQRYQ